MNRRASEPATRRGHRFGGPFAFAVLLAACGGGAARPGAPEAPDLSRPATTYRQLGLMAGPAAFPAVAGFATLAGPRDSTWVVFGLSLPAAALRFQRDAEGFAAEYQVAVAFERDSVLVRRLEEREQVRVASFAETGRTDESIVFQQAVVLAPGRYEVALTVGDGRSSRGFRARDTLDVPAYGVRGDRIAAPVVVYSASARATVADPPDLILNPRHTAPYGGDPPRVYLEAYEAAAPLPLALRVLDAQGEVVWTEDVTLARGDSALRAATVALPGDTLPVGRLWIEAVAARGASPRSALVMSISDQWIVANFEEALDFLRYIATREEIEELESGSPSERRALWDDFWRRRDAVPATAANEFRDEFFERIRFATEQFAEGPIPGWRTDRGEVFVVLGAPDQMLERWVGRNEVGGRPNGIEWLYERVRGGRIVLLFLDRSGFGRYELIPASRAAFRAAAERLRARLP